MTEDSTIIIACLVSVFVVLLLAILFVIIIIQRRRRKDPKQAANKNLKQYVESQRGVPTKRQRRFKVIGYLESLNIISTKSEGTAPKANQSIITKLDTTRPSLNGYQAGCDRFSSQSYVKPIALSNTVGPWFIKQDSFRNGLTSSKFDRMSYLEKSLEVPAIEYRTSSSKTSENISIHKPQEVSRFSSSMSTQTENPIVVIDTVTSEPKVEMVKANNSTQRNFDVKDNYQPINTENVLDNKPISFTPDKSITTRENAVSVPVVKTTQTEAIIPSFSVSPSTEENMPLEQKFQDDINPGFYPYEWDTLSYAYGTHYENPYMMGMMPLSNTYYDYEDALPIEEIEMFPFYYDPGVESLYSYDYDYFDTYSSDSCSSASKKKLQKIKRKKRRSNRLQSKKQTKVGHIEEQALTVSTGGRKVSIDENFKSHNGKQSTVINNEKQALAVSTIRRRLSVDKNKLLNKPITGRRLPVDDILKEDNYRDYFGKFTSNERSLARWKHRNNDNEKSRERLLEHISKYRRAQNQNLWSKAQWNQSNLHRIFTSRHRRQRRGSTESIKLQIPFEYLRNERYDTQTRNYNENVMSSEVRSNNDSVHQRYVQDFSHSNGDWNKAYRESVGMDRGMQSHTRTSGTARMSGIINHLGFTDLRLIPLDTEMKDSIHS